MTGNQKHNGMKENWVKSRNKEQVTGDGTWPHSSGSTVRPEFVHEKYHLKSKCQSSFISAFEKNLLEVLSFHILASLANFTDLTFESASLPHPVFFPLVF